MASWKEHERATSKALGGKGRTGPQGRSIEDVVHEWLTIECKYRKRLPNWLKDAVQQAVDAGTTKNYKNCPIVVLHEKYRNRDDDLVVIRRKDFIEWFNPGGKSPKA